MVSGIAYDGLVDRDISVVWSAAQQQRQRPPQFDRTADTDFALRRSETDIIMNGVRGMTAAQMHGDADDDDAVRVHGDADEWRRCAAAL